MATFPDNQIPPSWNPWVDWGVRMWWPVAPSDWSDMDYWFYTHWANLGKWWWQSGFDIVARDAIHSNRREFWMAYAVTSWVDAWKVYVLQNLDSWWVDNNKDNNVNWIEYSWWDADLEENWISKYEVTVAFEANEIIDVTNWAGSVVWSSTITGDSINTLGISATDFNNNNNRQVRLIGVGCISKGVYAIWDSATTFHFSDPLSIWDRFEIIVESNN